MKKQEMMDESWNFLPEELIMEIFSRLPIKSLLRFKCLNKTWRSSILSSDFATIRNRNRAVSHLCQSKNRIHSFFKDAVTDLHIPFPFNSDGYKSIVGSSNGLVCIKLSHQSSTSTSSFVVWNPATREFRYLPKPVTLTGPSWCMGPSWCINGFDFLPGGGGGGGGDGDGDGDYKLVLFNFFRGRWKQEFVLRVQVFTRTTNSWKQINDELVPRLGLCNFHGVVVNGSIYWPEVQIEVAGYGIDGCSIRTQYVACFDLWKETFTRIMASCCHEIFRHTRRLGVVKGSLAMFFTGDSPGCFEGWLMNGQDQSWTKLFIIGPLSPTLALPIVRLVGLWLNDEIIIEINHHDEVFLYEPLTKELKDLPANQGHYLFPYKETRFSV